MLLETRRKDGDSEMVLQWMGPVPDDGPALLAQSSCHLGASSRPGS